MFSVQAKVSNQREAHSDPKLTTFTSTSPDLPASVFGRDWFEKIMRDHEIKALGCCPTFCATRLSGNNRIVFEKCEAHCEEKLKLLKFYRTADV